MNAPKVTPESIEAKIKSVNCAVLPDSTVTVCRIVMQNGYSVIGTSACAHPDNFDENVGKRLAREDAVRKIWPLEGYLLRQRLHEAEAIEITEDRS